MRLLVVLVAVLALVGCGASAGTPDPSAASRIGVILAEALAESGDGSLGAFWATEIKKLGDDAYQPPAAVLPYAPGTLPPTACTASGPPEAWSGNAVYCDTDNKIGYDVDFLVKEDDEAGHIAPLLILAHEWGHHIQHLRGTTTELPVQRELQADCFAGIYLEHLGRVDALTEGQIAQTLFTFYNLGERSGATRSWFDPDNHGDAVERARAIGVGVSTGDVTYCDPFDEFEPGADVALGPFTMGIPPGITMEVDGPAIHVVSPNQTVAGLQYVPDKQAGDDIEAFLRDLVTRVKAQPIYKGAAFLEQFGPGFGEAMPGQGASVGYVRVVDDVNKKLAHGQWVAQLLPTEGALLLNVEAPGPATDWRDVLDFRFLLLWQLCIESVPTYTCPNGAPGTAPSPFSS